jgi:hypothetical protein
VAYATATQLKTYLGISDSGDDTLLADLLTRAQVAIETYCNRKFEKATATRYYRADALGPDPGPARQAGTQAVLLLDEDLLAVTTLTNGDATVIPAAGYWLEPRNSSPKFYIRLKSDYSWSFTTDGEISVAGDWGYSTTAPADIVQATLRLAAFFYRQKDAQVFDTVASPELGVITVPKGIPVDIRLLLDPYRKRVSA